MGRPGARQAPCVPLKTSECLEVLGTFKGSSQCQLQPTHTAPVTGCPAAAFSFDHFKAT